MPIKIVVGTSELHKTQTEQERKGSQHSPIAAAGVTQTVTKVPVETSGPFLSIV